MYRIINSGSDGNAVIYGNKILVDCGVPFTKIKPYAKDLMLVLLTHIHGDHLKVSALNKLIQEKPSIRIACGEFLYDKIKGISKNIDILEIGELYNYNQFKVSPIRLYHDVPNFGYRIFIDGKKIIHATDTNTLQGITAKNYDLYAIEANYDEDIVYDIIKEKMQRGEYAHERGSINSHLSLQQAEAFIEENDQFKQADRVFLHQSKSSFKADINERYTIS